MVALALGLLLTAAFLWVRPLLPFFLALGLAYAFSPLVDRLQARGVSRSVSALGLLALLLLVVLLLLAYVVPTLLNDAQAMLQSLPESLSTATARLSALGQKMGVELPSSAVASEALRLKLNSLSAQTMGGNLDLARWLWSSLGNAVNVVLNLLLVPVFFFFLLRDMHQIKHGAFQLVPVTQQALVKRGYAAVDQVFSSYLRGQMILASILGVVLATGLMLLGVKFGLLIGLLAGFLNLIPYVGQITGVTLAMVMGLVDFQSWAQVAAIPVLFAGMNFVEGTFITPHVVGRKVGLSSVETLLALIAGAELAGLVGLILVVPLMGCLKLLIVDLAGDYKASKFYRT